MSWDLGAKSASAAWRAPVIRSRSSPRSWCSGSNWSDKGRSGYIAARAAATGFMNFYTARLRKLGGWLEYFNNVAALKAPANSRAASNFALEFCSPIGAGFQGVEFQSECLIFARHSLFGQASRAPLRRGG